MRTFLVVKEKGLLLKGNVIIGENNSNYELFIYSPIWLYRLNVS